MPGISKQSTFYLVREAEKAGSFTHKRYTFPCHIQTIKDIEKARICNKPIPPKKYAFWGGDPLTKQQIIEKSS